MRDAFIKELTAIAAEDLRIVLLTGDLGYLVVEQFAEQFPERFFNVGVAEQNMIGLATGLAESGYLPYVYSIVSFASLRGYEFIRNGPVAHQLPLRIAAIGEGFAYGANGASHFGLEDIAVMRALPSMTVIAPVSKEQTTAAVRATANLPGPLYFRLGKNNSPTESGLELGFKLGVPDVIRSDGKEVLVVTTGSVSAEASRSCSELATKGLGTTLLAVTTLGGVAQDSLASWLVNYKLIVTIEEHLPVGGLGSLVAEIIAEAGSGARLVRCAIDPSKRYSCGSHSYLRELHGLSADCLVRRIYSEARGDRTK